VASTSAAANRTFRVSARVSVDREVFRGPDCPVALKLWGKTDVQSETARADARTVELRCTFEVAPGSEGEHIIECEGRGIESSVTYQFNSIQLNRLQ